MLTINVHYLVLLKCIIIITITIIVVIIITIFPTIKQCAPYSSWTRMEQNTSISVVQLSISDEQKSRRTGKWCVVGSECKSIGSHQDHWLQWCMYLGNRNCKIRAQPVLQSKFKGS